LRSGSRYWTSPAKIETLVAVAVNSARFRWNKLIESIGLSLGSYLKEMIDRAQTARTNYLQFFRRWHKPILQLIEATEESVIIRTEIYDRRPLKQWSEQRVTLVYAACSTEQPPEQPWTNSGRIIDAKGKILTRRLAVE
jgi:hypothetical protein